MILLFNKSAFLSFFNNIFKKMVIYFSKTELVFSIQPTQIRMFYRKSKLFSYNALQPFFKNIV